MFCRFRITQSKQFTAIKALPAEDVIGYGWRLNKFLSDAVQGMRCNVGNSEVGTEVVFYFPLGFFVCDGISVGEV